MRANETNSCDWVSMVGRNVFIIILEEIRKLYFDWMKKQKY